MPGARYASPAEQGRALSHAALWTAAEAAGHAWRLVAEDDCTFHPRFARHLRELWHRVPKTADLVYLGLRDHGAREYVSGSRGAVFRPEYAVAGCGVHALTRAGESTPSTRAEEPHHSSAAHVEELLPSTRAEE